MEVSPAADASRKGKEAASVNLPSAWDMVWAVEDVEELKQLLAQKGDQCFTNKALELIPMESTKIQCNDSTFKSGMLSERDRID